MTCRGRIPRGAMFWRIFYWLARVWYSGKIDSLGYHTPGEIYSLGYHTPEDWKIWITRRIFNQNQKMLNSLFSGPDWFEFWKKNWRSKISRDCPLKTSYFLINVSDKVGLNLPKTCNMYIHMYCIGSVKTFHRSQCSSFWSRILTRNKNGSRVTWVNLRSLCAGHWPTFVWTLFYPLDTLHHPPHASTTMTRHFIAGGGG